MFDLLIFPEAIAKTPRHLGVNVELQDYHDEVNLWDWLADSGASIVREFHPEQSLRTGPVDQSVWDAVRTSSDYEAFRRRVRRDPDGGLIQWGAYAFAEPVRWIGVPDGIVAKLGEIGVLPLVSMGYATKQYPRPLVKDLLFNGVPADDGIDWSAAASAYDYYFAMIHHFAKDFGSRYFLLHNEPECDVERFHMAPECSPAPGAYTRETHQLVMNCITTQWGVLARIARDAMDDVRELLGDDRHFFLAGPASGAWEPFFQKGGRYVDSLDYHHYHPAPEALAGTYGRASARAAEQGKRTSLSEFNVLPGNVPFAGMLFHIEAALEQARMLLQALRLSGPGDPVCEFMTLYLLHFPATHRNHKELLYGDMNLVDWSTTDRGLIGRPEEWYPTFEEQQVRNPTVAYSMYRMLSRCVPGADGPADGWPVLRNGIECLIDDAHNRDYLLLDTLVVDAGDRVYVNLLNRSDQTLDMPINLRPFDGRFATAVIRETGLHAHDKVRDELPIGDGVLELNLAAKTFTQIILTPLDLSRIERLRVEEQTATPGTTADLGLWQTTRLRAIATLDGRDVDVTSLNAIWTSDEPWLVPVHQGGLVQRIRPTARPVTLTVAAGNGVEAEPIVVPPPA